MSDNQQEDISELEEAGGEEFLDEEFGDEAWEEEGLEAGAESAAPVTKRKSSKFNLILIVCAVLAGGGFLLLKSGGGSTPAPVSQQPVEQQQTAETIPSPQLPPAQEAQMPEQMPVKESAQEPLQENKEEFSGGLLNNPENFKKVEQIRENMEFEEYTEGDNAKQWEEEIEAANVQAPATPATQEPLTPLPSTPESTAEVSPPDLPTAQNVTIPTSVTESIVPQAESADNLQASIDAVSKQLADLTSRMDDLETAVESLEIPSANSSEVADLKNTLEKLEKKIEDLAKSGSSSRKSASNAASTSSAVKPPVSMKPAVIAVGWILKSAQPGKAIVSKSGQGETYAVGVGDKLEGIGKITSVEKQGNLWVVQGSVGRITQ